MITVDVDLVIVPGLAFSRSGCRLGRGKGYCDRFLSGLRRFVAENRFTMEGGSRTIALAFSEQILDDICCEEHDEKIDHVLVA